MKRQEPDVHCARTRRGPGIPAVVPNLVEGRYLAVAYPADIGEERLFCGNGTIGANARCRPSNEWIIFTREKLFLPVGVPALPPDRHALD